MQPSSQHLRQKSKCPPRQRSVGYNLMREVTCRSKLLPQFNHLPNKHTNKHRNWLSGWHLVTWHRWWTCPGSSSPAASPPAWWPLKHSTGKGRDWAQWRGDAEADAGRTMWRAKRQTYDAEGIERELLPQQVHALLQRRFRSLNEANRKQTVHFKLFNEWMS